MEILLITLFSSLCLAHSTSQLVKALAIKKYSPGIQNELPRISVLVAAHNERENLLNLVPLILDQEYSDFEIIILLDRCDDESGRLTEQFINEKLNFIEINEVPKGIHPKKHAIQKGISESKGEWILLTDADCRPSKTWIQEMARHMSKDIVIGLSSYYRDQGFLNQLIQYETFQTALHFAASAALGKPYMALGRNLAYRKALFEELEGFGKTQGITGGDDDLLTQRLFRSHNYSLAFTAESKVESIPKLKWSDYSKQKTRHLSVGRFYPKWVKRKEALRWFFHMGMWLTFFPAFVTNPLITSVILVFTFIVNTISINIVANRLEKRFNHLWLPFVDLVYAVFIPLIGLRSLLVKNIKWN